MIDFEEVVGWKKVRWGGLFYLWATRENLILLTEMVGGEPILPGIIHRVRSRVDLHAVDRKRIELLQK